MHCDVRLARFVFDNCVSVPACEKIKDNFFTVDKFPHDRSQFCVSELVMNTKSVIQLALKFCHLFPSCLRDFFFDAFKM